MNIKVTRAKLESTVEDTVNRSIEPLKVALQDAGLSVSDVQDVIWSVVELVCRWYRRSC